MFPKFLLPSSVFNPKRRKDAGWPQSVGATDRGCHNAGHAKYLDGHASYVQCSHCATDICFTSQIISKGFTGRHGRAYLVSTNPVPCAVSVNTTSSPTDSLPNTTMQKPVSRQLVTGAHTVSDINCALCGNVLGWKYVAAEEESQRYKVGKFILETKRTMTSSSWESGIHVNPNTTSIAHDPSSERVEMLNNPVEFDSQDEDECEDLFAGIWNPGLAMRRRSRKLEGHSLVFGLTAH